MPSPQKIIDIASAFYKSQTLFAAVEVGLFGKISELGNPSCAELAQALNLDLRATRLLLDACVAIGLLLKDGDEKYANTPDSALFLVPGAPADLSKAISYNRDVYQAWGKTAEFVRLGQPVEKPEIHLGEDAERTRRFVMSMHYRALGIGRAVVPQLALGDCRKLFDVGGGPGTYATLIAQHNPQISCITADLPEVSAIAKELVAQYGLSERVHCIPGDYHNMEFPQGLDAVLFFGVLHQESPESILNLFKKAASALNSNGKVYIMDMMTDASRTAPEFSALFALNMALTTQNGWVFSDNDLRNWLAQAGFTDFCVSPLAAPMPHWLASAVRK